MRPLRSASPLARVIATLGVLTVLSQAVVLEFGAKTGDLEVARPDRGDHLPGDIVVGRYAFWLLGIAALVALLLTVTSVRTRFGYAISAAAENPRAASALGWSPDLLASVTWAVGGGLRRRRRSAAAGHHRRASSRRSPFSILIIGGLATALLGGFKSYPLALLGGVFLGVAQSLATHWSNDLLEAHAPAGHPRRGAVPGDHRGPGDPRSRAAAARQHHRPAAPGRHRPDPAGLVLVVLARPRRLLLDRRLGASKRLVRAHRSSARPSPSSASRSWC